MVIMGKGEVEEFYAHLIGKYHADTAVRKRLEKEYAAEVMPCHIHIGAVQCIGKMWAEFPDAAYIAASRLKIFIVRCTAGK